MIKRFVYTTFRLEGYHYYPNAEINEKTSTKDYLDVSHLGYRHMHYFDFKVWVEVKDTNRDIEFIQLRRKLLNEVDSKKELNNLSCEMISDKIYNILKCWYPLSDIKIDVSEEGINGSYTEYLGRD